MFNPVTQEVAYAAAKEKDCVIVVGREIRAVHSGTWFPRWSPDGKTLAYAAEQEGASFVVVGDRKLKTYDEVSGPKFAPDGRLVTYTARTGDRSVVVVGETEFGPYENAIAYAIDASNRPIAVAQGKELDQKIVWKGVAGRRFDAILTVALDPQGRVTFEPVISPDVSHTAFRGSLNQKWHVIVDDQVGEAFDAIALPVFSPDSRRVAYVAMLAKAVFVVVGARRHGPYSFAGPPQFSPDGRKVAFGARIANEFWWKVIDVD